MSEKPFLGDEADTEELDLEGEAGSIDDVMEEALKAVESSPAELENQDPFSMEVGTDMGELRDEVKELRDRSMRTLADFDNFRKRVEREREEQRKYAGADVLRDVLTVVDNLERALSAEGGVDELKQGVELILRQVMDMLKHHGVERVPSEGEAFDPSVHEAVLRTETAEVDLPTIVREMQSGYWLRERLLRPSMVEVAVPVPRAAPQSQETDEPEGGGE